MILRRLSFALISSLIVLTACSNAGEEQVPPPVPNRPAAVAPANPQAGVGEPTGGVVELAGVAFMPAEDWKDLGPSGMRKATYQFGPVEGDELPAEVTVFFFGEGQGGAIEPNIVRWIGQMTTPEGDDASNLAVRSKLTTGLGLNIHFVELDGTYMKSMGGGPMTGGRKKAFPDHRMVGGIVEAPGGNVFMKLVGPMKTARAMEVGFREMLGATVKLYEGD